VRSRFLSYVAAASAAGMLLAPPPARAQEVPPGGQVPAPPQPQPPQSPADKFSGNAVIGMSLENGRTDLNGYQLTLQGKRPYSKTGTFTLSGGYTKATTQPPGAPKDFTVADRLTGDFGVEQNYRKHWVLMSHFQGLRDPIEHIDYEVELIVGAGGRWYNKQAEFRVVPGIAFISHDKNIRTENGFNTNVGVYQDFKVTFAKMWVFTQYFSGSHDVKDNDDYTLAFDTRLTGAFTKRFGLQLQYHYDYESLLFAGTEPNYSKIVTGLQITF
jgi:hypothetical protein